MVVLPVDWDAHSGESLTLHLQRRMTACDAHFFADAIVWASLQLSAATFMGRGGMKVQRKARHWWAMRGLHYRYVPDVNNDLFERIPTWHIETVQVTLVAPAEQDRILAAVLRSLHDNCCPTVFSVGAFISYRVFMAAVDMKWTRAETLQQLMKRYNRCVQKLDRNDLAAYCLGEDFKYRRFPPRLGQGLQAVSDG